MNAFHPSLFNTPLRSRRAFTLVEVLVSMVILSMIMLIITQVIGQAQSSWRKASSRVTQFREARIAFDTITRNLRQATLNSYRNFLYANGTQFPSTVREAPIGYRRYAELGFRTDTASTIVMGGGSEQELPGHSVVFQAPLGKSVTKDSTDPSVLEYDQLKSLLCIRGYFVRFGSDSDYIPAGLRGRLEERNRYRLYEYRPPTEFNTAYSEGATGESTGGWTTINYGTNKDYVAPVAENVLMLILAPSFASQSSSSTGTSQISSLDKASFYSYNSFSQTSGAGTTVGQHRLPRSVQVSLVAIDEESAKRLSERSGSTAPDVLGKSGASFTDPSSFEEDMEKLKRTLTEMRMNYRVFSSNVFIPGADV